MQDIAPPAGIHLVAHWTEAALLIEMLAIGAAAAETHIVVYFMTIETDFAADAC